MAEVVVSPIILNDAVITFGVGGDDYAAAVNTITITNNRSVVVYKGLKKNTHSFSVDDGWTATVNFAQDWANADSLANYLYEHRGETVPATLEPTSGVGKRWSFDAVLPGGTIGGGRDAVMTTDVTIGVDGEPIPSDIV